MSEVDETFKVIRTLLLADSTFAALNVGVYASEQVPQITAVWKASTAYVLNQSIVANGHYFKASTPGTSGATEPTWPTTAGGMVTSGTAVFRESGLVYPYCLLDFVSGEDMDGAGTVRIMSKPLFLARAVNRGSVDSTTQSVGDAMDDVLQGMVRAQSSGFVFSMRRERPYRRSYRDANNNVFSETGGYYRGYVA